MLSRIVSVVFFLCVMLWHNGAQAVLTIEITQGESIGVPIAVVPFRWEGATKPSQDVSGIISADLGRSGRFNLLPEKDFVSTPNTHEDVVFKEWRILKAEALVIGSVTALTADRLQIQFRLYDVFKEAQLAGFSYSVKPDMLRTVTHQISDIVYEKLMGEPGAFNTRIAYISKETAKAGGSVYKLQVADSDGFNPTTVVRSIEPLLSTAWSPDGNSLAYVSFEKRLPRVFIHNLITGKRDLIAKFTGINSAPAWSPDGRRLALTLSRDGKPEIYVLDLTTRRLMRLTNSPAINTEPAWSPNGRQIVFTSDRAGNPQIYRMNANGDNIERMTYEGDYNARASYSADGRLLTLVTRERGNYHIGILDVGDKSLRVLTDTPLDESPSFAPNGRMILYATNVRGRGVLASVSADGRVRQLFKLDEGDIREPAWSPYNLQLVNKE